MGRSKRRKKQRQAQMWNMISMGRRSFEAVNLTTTYADIIGSDFFQQSKVIREALNDGRLSRFNVLCEGPWSKRSLSALREQLKANDCEWVMNHLLVTRSDDIGYTNDAMASVETTHIVSLDARWLAQWSTSSKITPLSLANRKLGGWPGMLNWIGSKIPAFENLPQSFDIINV